LRVFKCAPCAKRTSSIIIRNKLRETNLVTAFENLDHSIDSIEDGYPAWHPAPLSFRAMVFSFVFVEITVTHTPTSVDDLPDNRKSPLFLGFSRVPDESAFSGVAAKSICRTNRVLAIAGY